jgi:hypothetical protein
MAAHNGRPVVPPVPADAQQPGWDTAISTTVNGLLAGLKANAVTTVTLAANMTSTVLTDDRIGYYSHLGFEPTTSSAMTARASLWWTATDGSVTINHASNAAADQTFSVIICG